MYRIVCVSDEEIPKWFGRDLVLVQLDDPLTDFVYFVLTEFGPKHETILWAHNGGRFDSHFVMQILYRIEATTTTGDDRAKIYDISVKMKGHKSTTFSWQLSCFANTPDSLKEDFQSTSGW